jgi:glutathione S-transferase
MHGGGRLLPDDSRSRGLAWVIEEYADEVLGPLLRRASRGMDAAGRPLDDGGRNALKTEMAHHYEALEQLLGGEDYALGSRLTLADIALYAFISRLELYSPRGVPPEYPKIRAWYSRMKS